MQTQSDWLGPFRGPVRLLTLLTVGIAVLLTGYLIFNRLILGGEIGMNEMLRPEGRVVVYATLISLFVAIPMAGIYLSDMKGSIETDRTGPFDILSLVLSRIAMIGTVMIVMVMFYEVVARYLFEAPTLWANELSLWMASFLFLLAGLYAMQQRSHIRIYIIYDLMPRWMRKLADVISLVLIWAFVICTIWGMYDNAIARIGRWEKFGTAWDPPIPATVIPGILIISLLVALQATSNLIADWNKEEDHHSPADEIDETEIENLRRIAEGKN